MARRRPAACRSAGLAPAEIGSRNSLLDERRLWLKALGLGGTAARTAPAAVRVILILVLLPPAFTAANLVYQVVRKPTEVFFPLSSLLNKDAGRNLAGTTAPSSANIRPPPSRRSCWRRWPRPRAPAIRWPRPIGAGA